MKTPFFELQDVHGGYGRGDIVRGVTLSADEGDFLGIIGPNGSGKTTLVRLMSRVVRPSQGSLMFCGSDIWLMAPRHFFRVAACVMQETYVRFSYTVYDMVLMGRIPHLGRFQACCRGDFRAADRALELTGCAHLRARRIQELSSGERQRVMIAKALAQEPRILFLDEPTAHLDIAHQTRVLDLLRELNGRERLTIVLVIHDLNAAAEYCTGMVLVHRGRVCAAGDPEGVLTYENIESAYETVVVTSRNPVTGKPFVCPVPGERAQRK